jgi:hypothetical protein
MRICKVCSLEQPLDNYTVTKGYHIYTCKKCMQIRNKAWAQQNKEKMNAYVKAYKERNREILAERAKTYVQQNPEKRKATMQSYRQKNKSAEAENVRRRQAKLLQRTPKWITVDDIWMMREAYALAQLRTQMFGFAWHVDHILPLRGKTVSGLHVPQNIQVISGAENLAKANRTAVS